MESRPERAGNPRLRRCLAILTLAAVLPSLSAAEEPPGRVVSVADLTSEELADLLGDRALLVIVAAPIEQHGPHLPLSTDVEISCWLASYVADRFASEHPGWTVLMHPPLCFSPCVSSDGFPGNASSTPQAIVDALTETLRGYAEAGCRYCLIIDNHLEPDAQVGIGRAAKRARKAWGIRVVQPEASLIFDEAFRKALGSAIADPSPLGADIHAGLIETSAMLAIAPSSVRTETLDDLPPFPMTSQEFGLRYAAGQTMREMGAERGYIGAPNLASAEFGRSFLELLGDGIYDYACRLADPSDEEVFSDARTFFASIPMQGSTYAFAYPVARGTVVDGFTPGILAFGQSADRTGATLFTGWGFASRRPILQGHLALGQFFLDPVELTIDAGNAGGIAGASVGLRLYGGTVPPGFRHRPRLRFESAFRAQEAKGSDRDPLLASSRRIDSLFFQAEYDPGLDEPFAYSETGISSHDPAYARAGYELGPGFLGNSPGWDVLSVDARCYVPLSGDRLTLAGKSLVFWGGLARPDSDLPGHKLLAGAGPSVFRGLSRIEGNLFSRAIVQSLDLRGTLKLRRNPALAALGLTLFADAGFGCSPGGELLDDSSFRMDAGAAFILSPAFIPMRFRFEFGIPVAGKNVGSDWCFSFGIGPSF